MNGSGLNNLIYNFFLRASLHCVPASQNTRHAGSSCARVCDARKVLCDQLLRHAFAAAAHSFRLSKTFFISTGISLSTSTPKNPPKLGAILALKPPSTVPEAHAPNRVCSRLPALQSLKQFASVRVHSRPNPFLPLGSLPFSLDQCHPC